MSAGLLVVCGAVGLGVAGLMALACPPTPRLAMRVRPYTVSARARLGRSPELPVVAGGATIGAGSTVARLFGPPIRALVARLGRVLERRDDDALRLALRQAGIRTVSPDDYRSRVAAELLGFGAAGAAVGVAVTRSAPAAIGLAACGAIVGASRGRGRLERAIRERRERLRLELYTVNQLLAMHLRTGAGPVQATRRVVERGTGAVVDELNEVLAALRRGVPEPEAFRRAAELTPEPAAARTYRLFAAGAERGVDLADGLRALSEDLRDSRREEIRKVATKRRAAMLVPTIAVLAPVMLLFIAAPLPSIVFGQR